jgi:hypothetical protein
MSEFEALPDINLDPRTESIIAQEAQLQAFNSSNGKLNDFSAGSPLRALVEAQAFCGGEVLWYLNKSVPAIALQFYKNVGVERRLGTKATVTLTFTLQQTQQIPFTIPANFKVLTTDNSRAFLTNETLTIPPGSVSGSVTATAEVAGSASNVAPQSITLASQPLVNLKSVTNLSPAQGGSDKETIDQTIKRGNEQLRSRGLVSRADYEERAKQIVGVGSNFKVLGNVGADKESYELGSVHLFGIDPSKNPITESQITQLNRIMQDEIHLASTLYISPMDVEKATIDIVVVVSENYIPSVVGDRIWDRVASYVDPSTWKSGKTLVLRELEYRVRDSEGVAQVTSVLVNGNHLNVPLPNQYTVFDISQMNLVVTNERGLELVNEVYSRNLVE